jgi:hypothetical protein
MLTAPAVVRSRFKWHTRATWSARENRIPSLVWLALIWFGMVAGFGLDMPRFSTSLRRPLRWWMFMPSSSPCGCCPFSRSTTLKFWTSPSRAAFGRLAIDQECASLSI